MARTSIATSVKRGPEKRNRGPIAAGEAEGSEPAADPGRAQSAGVGCRGTNRGQHEHPDERAAGAARGRSRGPRGRRRVQGRDALLQRGRLAAPDGPQRRQPAGWNRSVEGGPAGRGALNGAGWPVREALAVWAAIIVALAALELIGRSLPFVHGLVGAAAVAAFPYLPLRMLERRGQDARDAGRRFDRLPRDLTWSLGACAVVPPFLGGCFVLLARRVGHLPPQTQHWIAPYARFRGFHLDLAMSWELAGQIAGNAAVAFSEEFFYRGYMTLRFEERWGPVRSALAAAALFAVGHLLTPAPWRLAVVLSALVL